MPDPICLSIELSCIQKVNSEASKAVSKALSLFHRYVAPNGELKPDADLNEVRDAVGTLSGTYSEMLGSRDPGQFESL